MSKRHSPDSSRAAAVESLEKRRLLSVSLDLAGTIASPDPALFQQFGTTIATQGALALVGVPGATVLDGATPIDQAGVVYLIDTSTNTTIRRFDNPDPQFFEQFGTNVAFVGSSAIAITAPGDIANGGSVYIYDSAADATPDVLDGSALIGPGLPFPGFGTAIAAYGANGLLVDVAVDPFSPLNNGFVQLYDLDTLSVVRTFVNPDNTSNIDRFGSELAVSGDQILFSARVEVPGNAHERVVFQMNGDTGALVRTYHQPVPLDDQVFGFSLAFSGDDVLISAPLRDLSLPELQAGVVYHFDASTGQLLHTIQNPDQSDDDAAFGFAMAIAGDVAMISAPLQWGMAWQIAFDPDTFEPILDEFGNPVLEPVELPVGAVYAIDLITGDTLATAASPTPAEVLDAGTNNNFGWAVAALPDAQFLVGTPGDDHGIGTDSGAIYLYTLEQDTPSNQSPIADAGPDQSVDQGATLVLSGIASDDPDDDPLTYAWSIDGGEFTAPSADPTFAFTQSRPGLYTLTLRVADPSGATSTDDVIVTVNNVAPQVGPILAPALAVRQQHLTFVADVADAGGPGDLVSAVWDFGDGSPAESAAIVDGQVTANHAFADAGTYTVTLSVADVDSGLTTVAFDVLVQATALVDGDLLVGSNTAATVITVTPAGGIRIGINGTTQTYTSVPGKIIVYGGPGVDVITVANAVTHDVELYGGNGANVLKGGSGDDIIVGGDGLDLILGGNGRDLLIGGRGIDFIVGNSDDDILIAGPTAHDNDPSALRAIMSVWTSTTLGYAARVDTLRGTLLRADLDVFDDGVTDILTGNAGSDWFIFNQDGPMRDIVTDLRAGETFNDVDVLALSAT
jgi:PKD repeat protein